MKLIILKNNFKKGLESLGRITGESITTLPILKNILLQTIDNQIKCSSTNLELAITVHIPGKIIETGSITIPFLITNTLINNIASERINFEVNDVSVVLQTDNYHAKIQGIKKDEFPIIPDIQKQNKHIEIKTATLRDALQSVLGSVQVLGTKPELGGVLISVENEMMKFVTTDGIRLSEKKIPNTQFKTKEGEEYKIIVPQKTIQEIVRIISPEEYEYVDIYIDQNQILFHTENIRVISRLINGEFPEYQNIIPTSAVTEVVVNKEQVLQALKLVSSFTDRLNEVKIIIKEHTKNIEVYAFNQSIGENQYLVPAKIKNKEKEGVQEVVFNWKFLLEGIKNIHSENIVIGLNSDNKPALIKSPEDYSYLYVIMPIKSL